MKKYPSDVSTSDNKLPEVPIIRTLMRSLGFALSIAIVMTVLMLFLFNGQDAALKMDHLVIFVILFGALIHGAISHRRKGNHTIGRRTRFFTQTILLSKILFFVLAINGLLSLFDYLSILDDLYLPLGSAGHYAVHVLLVLCSLTIFGMLSIALLMVTIPKGGPSDK